MARPYIARSVYALGRFTAQKCTEERLKAAQKIFGYLISTIDRGVVYSPQSEHHFEIPYTVDGEETKSEPPKINLFTDASFASKCDGHYSVSGFMVTYHGAPLRWKSTKQSLLAKSTC